MEPSGPTMNPTDRSHERHDRHLVAALAADDLDPNVRAEAERLVASCRDCAQLQADLRSIALATAALLPVRRSRDFRLSPADAARLRPSGWHRVAEALAGARFAFTRPLAVGLATMGVVGILATSVPLGSGAAAPAAAPDRGVTESQFGTPPTAAAAGGAGASSGVGVTTARTAGPELSPYAPLPTAKSGGPDTAFGSNTDASPFPSLPPQAVASTALPTVDQGRELGIAADDGLAQSSSGSSVLLRASLVSLVLGIGLLAARWGAGRVVRRR
jgi:hypothetical protein